MKKSIFTSLLALCTSVVFAQSQQNFDETVNRFQNLFNSEKPEDIHGMMSERIKSLMPKDKTKEAMNQLHSQMGNLTQYKYVKTEGKIAFYESKFEKGALLLAVSLDEQGKLESFRFLPSAENQVANTVVSNSTPTNFSYKSNNGIINGYLSTPNTKDPVPVVLFIAGSGPTDKDGNQMPNIITNCYKQLADSLATAGIACLRYDKRGVASSSAALTDESLVTFDTYVDDAVGIAKQLKEDKRFSSVYILGHSEGSLIGILAAQKTPVAGLISLAGIGNSADKIIVRQLAAQSEELSLKAAFIMDTIAKGKTVTNVPEDLAPIFRPSMQPYLKSWFKYTPANEIAKVQSPILILQGSTDLQVNEDEAQMLKSGNTKATLKIINGMNHVLKMSKMDRESNLATYNAPSLPISLELITSVKSFVIKK